MRADFSMSVEPMRQEDIEEVALMASQSYQDNPLVKKGLLTSETIRKNETLSLKALLQAQKVVNKKLNRNTVFNFVVRDKGQMVLAFSSCEYQYYVQNLLEKLEMQLYVKNLQQESIENPHKEGEVIFEKRIFVHYDNMNKGLASKFWSQLSLYFISQGYFYAYAFTSNPKSYHIYKKMEGKLIRELVFEGNDDHSIIQFCFRKIYRMAKSSYFQLKSQ